MKNKNILIGLVGLGILYALYMKNKKKNKEANTTPTPNKTRFTPYMPQIKPNTIEEERAFAIKFYKTLPDNFTFDNVNYTKNSDLEFYKQPFTPNSISGVKPIKISGAEFSNAYNKQKQSLLDEKCVKWVQPNCIAPPCPRLCVQYKDLRI